MSTTQYELIARVKLTPAQQDYLEACLKLSQAGSAQQGPAAGVRVTDIAEALGTRLPTVSRSLARLRRMGLVEQQQERGPVALTELGRQIAGQLLHRHEDVTRFLIDVLGVAPALAEDEACVIEHGLSGASAQRLHEFLERWDRLAEDQRTELAGRSGPLRAESFTLVGRASGAGRRH